MNKVRKKCIRFEEVKIKMFRPKFNTSNAGHSWPESAPGAWEQGKRRQRGDVPRHTHTGGLCVGVESGGRCGTVRPDETHVGPCG